MAVQKQSTYYNPKSKLILIGQNFSTPFKMYACDAAIQRTEVYEYLLSLTGGNPCPSFQTFKILYAWRLFRAGRFTEALRYAEAIATVLLATSATPCTAMTSLLELCDALPQKLAYWVEPPWMKDLKRSGKHPAHEDLNEPQPQPQPPACLSNPTLLKVKPKKKKSAMKRFWIRCFSCCGRAQE
ncbi:protein transport protein Sec16B-like [Clupea harengus]|uniref:Protein transport protein Sec16B-like n=1 Tax=Clupea harengus TaxID=7950 RepID=A0A8M1KUZ0_CLUHA|nr:protein transport protein Sec16B-like [Clupea harengus]